MDVIYGSKDYNIVAKCNYNTNINKKDKDALYIEKVTKSYSDNLLDSLKIEEQKDATKESDMPITNIGFLPNSFYRSDPLNRLLISSSNSLNLLHYSEESNEVTDILNLTLLKYNKNNTATSNSNSFPPITSFDFNITNNTDVIQSCIDTTCTVYDLTKQKIKTQLIAHDDLVLDVKYLNNNNTKKNAELFMTCGNDGSLRLFDLRTLDHSSILYEDSEKRPLLSLEVNPLDSNKILCFALNSKQLAYIDLRFEKNPLKKISINSNITSCLWLNNGLDFLTGDNNNVIAHWNINNLKTVEKPNNFFIDEDEYQTNDNVISNPKIDASKNNSNNNIEGGKGIYKMRYIKEDNLINYLDYNNNLKITSFSL
ncbi:hypothetical protein ACO0SA_001116 [Hanseniaspora valbyensis]